MVVVLLACPEKHQGPGHGHGHWHMAGEQGRATAVGRAFRRASERGCPAPLSTSRTAVRWLSVHAGAAWLDSQQRRKSLRLALHKTTQCCCPPAEGDSGPAVKTFRTGISSDHLPGSCCLCKLGGAGFSTRKCGQLQRGAGACKGRRQSTMGWDAIPWPGTY